MLIDWFTVGAQAINFLILVWLLKRFLYKPILRAIDAREERVATEMADAAAKQTEADNARAEFEAKNDALDQAKAGVLAQATADAHAERERLLEEARQAANALGAQRQKALEEETRSLHTTLEENARKEVFEVVRKTLTDLASTTLEERMVETFLTRLKGLDGETTKALRQLAASDPDGAVVRSAFDLAPAERETIDHAVREALGTTAGPQWETAPQLVSGIELVIGGHKLGWNIAEYLATMQRHLSEVVDRPGQVPTP